MLTLTNLSGFGGNVFTPQTTLIADTGSSGTIVIPTGSTSVVIEGWGPGGGGGGTAGTQEHFDGGGGGGGGYFKITRRVLASEWELSLTYTNGTRAAAGTVNPAGGTATTITGTLNGAAISCTANNGGNGSLSGGAGGTASGGDTNLTGQAGTAPLGSNTGGTGGDSANGGAGGAGGNPGVGTLGTAPGGGSGGAGSDTIHHNAVRGVNGQLQVAFT